MRHILAALTLISSLIYAPLVAEQTGVKPVNAAVGMTLSLTQSHFKSGSDVVVNVEVKNLSDTPTIYSMSWATPDVEIVTNVEIVMDNHEKVNETRLGRMAFNHLTADESRQTPGLNVTNSWFHLAPNESARYRVNIGRLFDLSKTGKYVVQFTRIDEKTTQLIKSNKVIFTID
jgi:hypothetical protein